jgi:hypothetical protein
MSQLTRFARKSVEVGAALLEIRDSRLYRDDYANFDEYCRDRWGWSHRHADRHIQAARVAGLLGPIGPKPQTEAVARELAPLAKDKKAVVEVWERVRPRECARQLAPGRGNVSGNVVPKSLCGNRRQRFTRP